MKNTTAETVAKIMIITAAFINQNKIYKSAKENAIAPVKFYSRSYE